MKSTVSDLSAFLMLVIEALNAAGAEYLMSGTIAEWAHGRTARYSGSGFGGQDTHQSYIKWLSKELEEWVILLPAEIIRDTIMEDRSDIPINAIHMYSGLKSRFVSGARQGDEIRQSAFQR